MRKLKIAFLSAGTLVHIGAYVDFFRERGHEVFLLAYDKPSKDFGVPTFDISHGASGKDASSKWKYFLAGLSSRKILRKIKPDVLHGHYVTSAGVISLLSGFRPIALTVHGSDLIGSMKSSLWRNILRRVFRCSAIVNPVSEELAGLIRSLGVPDDKILVATLGVDTSLFAFNSFESFGMPVRLLCTRTLGDVYDPGVLIKACEILKQKNISFKLTFAAGGPLESQLKETVFEKGLNEDVIFLGGYDQASLPGLLYDHDIYLSASLWDGTSISLLEAMSCGIFPIISRIASNQEWLTENENCYMFKCGDAAEVAEKIILALEDIPFCKSSTEKNRCLVEKKADREQNMLKLEERYYQVVSGKSAK